MSEFAWATADPVETVETMPAAGLPPVRGLVDFDADDAEELPTVGAGADGAHEDLVLLDHPRIRSLDVYQRHGFPAAIGSAFVREGVARRLERAVEMLPEPFGLAVFDGWRDPQLQQFLYDRAYADPELPPGFVAPPSQDPARPAPHSTGGTIDLTLSWAGTPLGLGTQFDDFTPDAYADALEGPTGESQRVARDLRRLLVSTMHAAGFVVLAREWWHFEHGTRLWSAIMERPARYPQAQRPPVGPAN